MKTIIALFLFVLSYPTYSQWIQQDISTTNTLLDIEFVNEKVGYVSDDHGKIFKTTNKGIEWIEQNTGTTDFLISLSFVDIYMGWALGQNTGTVIKTTNGGNNWVPLVTGIGNTLKDIQFVTNRVGWIVGYSGQIYKTTDGGINWITQETNTNINLWSVFFIDENIGYATGVGIILKTSNGGDTWAISYQTDTTKKVESFKSIYFTDSSNGWAVGQDWENGDGSIIHTNDGGATWRFQNSGVNGFRLQSACFLDKLVGWACGGEGTILSTFDSGNNWNIEETGTNNFLRDIFVVDGTHIYAVGVDGTIITNPKVLNLTVDWDWNEANFEVGYIQQITWESNNLENIKIEYTTNAEKNWITIEESYPAESGSYDWLIPNTPSIYCRVKISSGSISDKSPKNVVDDESLNFTYKWFFTIYGENKWVNVESPTTKNLTNIKFFNDNHGIAWSKNVLLETTNGGIDWNVKSEFESNGATFDDQDAGWLIINNYQDTDTLVVLRTLDGGLNWETQLKISSQHLYLSNLSFSDSVYGWLSLTEESSVFEGIYLSRILRTTNGGISWERIGKNKLLDPRIIFDSHVTNTNIGWMKHKDGYTRAGGDPNSGTYISYTFDDGNNWRGTPKPYTSEYESIYEHSAYFTNENHGWITQSHGAHITDMNYILYKIFPERNVETLYSSYSKGIVFNYFTNNDVGWCLGNQYNKDENRHLVEYNFIGYSVDGGISWELQKFGLSKDFQSINNFFSLDGEVCWAVGDNGAILKYTNEPTDVTIDNKLLVQEFSLSQNYPNPFNPTSKIKFGLPTESIVSLVIYNILGEAVIQLVNQQLKAGYHEVKFDASNYSSGIYFYRLHAGDYVETKKMILLK